MVASSAGVPSTISLANSAGAVATTASTAADERARASRAGRRARTLLVRSWPQLAGLQSNYAELLCQRRRRPGCRRRPVADVHLPRSRGAEKRAEDVLR